MARIESEHTEQLDRKDREIERLKSQLSSPDPEKTNDTPKSSPQISNSLEESQLNILRFVEKFDGKAPEKKLIQASENSQTKTEFDLGELVSKELLERNYRATAADYVYSFTHAGRSYLLAHPEVKTEKA